MSQIARKQALSFRLSPSIGHRVAPFRLLRAELSARDVRITFMPQQIDPVDQSHCWNTIVSAEGGCLEQRPVGAEASRSPRSVAGVDGARTGRY